MTDVALEREVPVAAAAVRAALRPVLDELSERSRAGELSLTARLAARDGVTLAEVGVPVLLTVGASRQPEGESIPIEVRASGPGAFFPTFSGAVDANERGPALTEVTLRGSYDAPLGPIGAALDATAFRGTAMHSLSALLERIIAAVNARLGREAERERRQSRGM
jgi:hypothetical protein